MKRKVDWRLKRGSEPGKNGGGTLPQDGEQGSAEDESQERVKDVGPHCPCADPKHCQRGPEFGLTQAWPSPRV